MKKYFILLSAAVALMACSGEKTKVEQSKTETNSLVPEKKEDLLEMINKNNEALTNNSGSDSLKFIANNQVLLCEAFVEQFKTDTQGALILSYGAKAARTAGRPQKAIQFYDQLIQLYSSYPNLAEIMFLKAFIYDEDLNDKDKAKNAYTALIQRFPGTQYAKDAKLLLEQLYMSDEELIKMFEEKNKK